MHKLVKLMRTFMTFKIAYTIDGIRYSELSGFLAVCGYVVFQ